MTHSTSLPRLCALATAAVTVAATVCGTASAQTEVAGFTNGCFGAGCTPETTQSPASDLLAGSGLTYNNSTFDVISAGGVAGVGSTGMATPAANVDNLGSWVLTGAPFMYSGSSFTLRVSFTAPAGTTPASALFTGALVGNVTSTDNGGLFIDFDNTPKTFTFGGVTFNLRVNDVSLTPGATPVGLTAFIDAMSPSTLSSAAEPGTYALLLAGIGAVGLMVRRRRRGAFS